MNLVAKKLIQSCKLLNGYNVSYHILIETVLVNRKVRVDPRLTSIRWNIPGCDWLAYIGWRI